MKLETIDTIIRLLDQTKWFEEIDLLTVRERLLGERQFTLEYNGVTVYFKKNVGDARGYGTKWSTGGTYKMTPAEFDDFMRTQRNMYEIAADVIRILRDDA